MTWELSEASRVELAAQADMCELCAAVDHRGEHPDMCDACRVELAARGGLAGLEKTIEDAAANGDFRAPAYPTFASYVERRLRLTGHVVRKAGVQLSRPTVLVDFATDSVELSAGQVAEHARARNMAARLADRFGT